MLVAREVNVVMGCDSQQTTVTNPGWWDVGDLVQLALQVWCQNIRHVYVRFARNRLRLVYLYQKIGGDYCFAFAYGASDIFF